MTTKLGKATLGTILSWFAISAVNLVLQMCGSRIMGRSSIFRSSTLESLIGEVVVRILIFPVISLTLIYTILLSLNSGYIQTVCKWFRRFWDTVTRLVLICLYGCGLLVAIFLPLTMLSHIAKPMLASSPTITLLLSLSLLGTLIWVCWKDELSTLVLRADRGIRRTVELTPRRLPSDSDFGARVVVDGAPHLYRSRFWWQRKRALVEALVIRSDRFVELWASRYIKLYRELGPEEAKKWAVEFLPPEARDKMSAKVRDMLNKNKRKS